jgi:hypothetical protein
MAFLAPLAPVAGGTAARFLGSRALGAAATRLGATRLGAGALSRSNIMSAAQFGASAMVSGSGGQASNQTVQRTPGPVQIG